MSVHDVLAWPFDMDAPDAWIRGYIVGIQTLFYGRLVLNAIWPSKQQAHPTPRA